METLFHQYMRSMNIYASKPTVRWPKGRRRDVQYIICLILPVALFYHISSKSGCGGDGVDSEVVGSLLRHHANGAAAIDVGDMKCLSIGDSDTRVNPEPDEVAKCQLYQPPSDFVRVVMNFVVGAPNQGRCAGAACAAEAPYDAKLREFGNDWPPFGYTMIGKQRLEQFRASIHEVDRNGIKGAIIETGVWRGGAMIMAAAVTRESDFGRRDVYLYDTFESIPGYGGHQSFLENKEDEVKGYFELFGMLEDNVHFVKGLFKDTVPTWEKGTPIAVLRVDGNFYDSYADVLYSMYEDVPVGGIVIFDDVMTHAVVMRCWQDFKRDQNLEEDLVRIDNHSAFFRKIKGVKVDQSKRLPPQDVNKAR